MLKKLTQSNLCPLAPLIILIAPAGAEEKHQSPAGAGAQDFLYLYAVA